MLSRDQKIAALAESFRSSSERELATARHLCATTSDWPNIYWHSGFAVELMLKAIRVKKQGLDAWPVEDRNARWHQPNYSVERAGIKEELKHAKDENFQFRANWLTIKDWDATCRYPPNEPNEAEAKDILRAVSHPTKGVIPWLRQVYQSL